jgi:hypothetical protein
MKQEIPHRGGCAHDPQSEVHYQYPLQGHLGNTSSGRDQRLLLRVLGSESGAAR